MPSTETLTENQRRIFWTVMHHYLTGDCNGHGDNYAKDLIERWLAPGRDNQKFIEGCNEFNAHRRTGLTIETFEVVECAIRMLNTYPVYLEDTYAAGVYTRYSHPPMDTRVNSRSNEEDDQRYQEAFKDVLVHYLLKLNHPEPKPLADALVPLYFNRKQNVTSERVYRSVLDNDAVQLYVNTQALELLEQSVQYLTWEN